jgi:ethanolamine utilization protein EutN
MQLANVIGQAVSTVKHPSMNGWRLLTVQPLGVDGRADGEPLLAIDYLGAANSDRVIISNDGSAAREMVGTRTSPVRWFVMGRVDSTGGQP